jgi:hypothetical protein
MLRGLIPALLLGLFTGRLGAQIVTGIPDGEDLDINQDAQSTNGAHFSVPGWLQVSPTDGAILWSAFDGGVTGSNPGQLLKQHFEDVEAFQVTQKGAYSFVQETDPPYNIFCNLIANVFLTPSGDVYDATVLARRLGPPSTIHIQPILASC